MKKTKNQKRVRKVNDTMGSVNVPLNALYSAQTQRAIDNFPISRIQFNNNFISAIVIIKRSAAIVNHKLGLLEKSKMEAIVKATNYILENNIENQFPIDIFQTGSGTSTNMNVNEVIANLGTSYLKKKQNKLHPNDHVNMGQSSNDVIPTAIHISSLLMVEKELIPSLNRLDKDLLNKSKEFKNILKIGRTHLQDATPMTLGQEFSGYSEIIKKSLIQINDSKKMLLKLAQGGTAIGTGINTHRDFGRLVAKEISKFTGIKFSKCSNHFEAQSFQIATVQFSGTLKTLAVGLYKISNDIRWLGSGPRSGIGELIIPPVQPGSSIMPGKVNPVICESMIQVCSQVIANDSAITLGGLGSIFELNLMLPLIAHNLLFSLEILSNSINIFCNKLLKDLRANTKKCNDYIEGSLAMCTSLVPIVGYDKAAEIAYEAYNKNKSIREVLQEKKMFTKKEIDKLLNAELMIKPK